MAKNGHWTQSDAAGRLDLPPKWLTQLDNDIKINDSPVLPLSEAILNEIGFPDTPSASECVTPNCVV